MISMPANPGSPSTSAMKPTFLPLLGSLLLACALPAAAEPLLQPNDRLAFCGDGLTGGEYTLFLEKYLIACQAIPGLDLKQFGWSAETPDAFLGRLDKDLVPWKPTVVTLLYNFGDDGKPLDQAAVDARSKSETDLINALKKTGVRAIVLGSPPCADSTRYKHDPALATAYNTKLAAVAAADKAVAAQEGIAYADVFGATTDMMAKAKAKLGADYNYAGDDFRQPQSGCNIAIAYAFLKALNLNGDIGTITLNFTPDYVFDKAEVTDGLKIVTPETIKPENAPGPNTLNVSITRYTFYVPHLQNPDVLMSCLPFYDDLSSLRLVTKGLTTTGGRVYWNENSSWHDFDAADLLKGAQLPGNMAWPFGGKFEEMDRDILDQMAADTKAGKAAAAGAPDPRCRSGSRRATRQGQGPGRPGRVLHARLPRSSHPSRAPRRRSTSSSIPTWPATSMTSAPSRSSTTSCARANAPCSASSPTRATATAARPPTPSTPTTATPIFPSVPITANPAPTPR